MSSDIFWTENPRILIKTYMNFIPTRKMTLYQQMNSLTLLSIYALVLVHLVGLANDITNILFVGIIVLLVILYYSKYNNRSDDEEKFQVESGYFGSDDALRLGKFYSENNRNTELDNDVYRASLRNKRGPTIDNPFMNPILDDFNTENVPYPVNIDDEVVQDEMKLTYNKDLFKDMTDLFDSKNVERQFYTIPGGAIPNDQQKFAEWCYKTPLTCKEDTGNCMNYDNMKIKGKYKF